MGSADYGYEEKTIVFLSQSSVSEEEKEKEPQNDTECNDDWPVIKTCRKDFSKPKVRLVMEKKSEEPECIDLTGEDCIEIMARKTNVTDVNSDKPIFKERNFKKEDIQTSFSTSAEEDNYNTSTQRSLHSSLQTYIPTFPTTVSMNQCTATRSIPPASLNTASNINIPLVVSATQSADKHLKEKSVSNPQYRAMNIVIPEAHTCELKNNSSDGHRMYTDFSLSSPALHLSTPGLSYHQPCQLQSGALDLSTKCQANDRSHFSTSTTSRSVLVQNEQTVPQQSVNIYHESDTLVDSASGRSPLVLPGVILTAPVTTSQSKELYSHSMGCQKTEPNYGLKNGTSYPFPNVIVLRPKTACKDEKGYQIVRLTPKTNSHVPFGYPQLSETRIEDQNQSPRISLNKVSKSEDITKKDSQCVLVVNNAISPGSNRYIESNSNIPSVCAISTTNTLPTYVPNHTPVLRAMLAPPIPNFNSNKDIATYISNPASPTDKAMPTFLSEEGNRSRSMSNLLTSVSRYPETAWNDLSTKITHVTTMPSHWLLPNYPVRGWSNIPVCDANRSSHTNVVANGYITSHPVPPSKSNEMVTMINTGAGDQKLNNLYASRKENSNYSSNISEFHTSHLKRSLNTVDCPDQRLIAEKQLKIDGEYIIVD